MKIVFVIDSWNEGNGGVTAAKRVVDDLIKRGHEITIVATGQHEGNYGFYEVPGFYLPGTKESLENMNFLFGRGKKRVLRKAYEGADLVHIQFPFLLARNAVIVAKKMHIPVIGACHIQPQNIIAATGKDSKFKEIMLYAFFNWSLFKQVDIIHCPSEFAANMLRNHGCKAHLEVISNGITDEYKPMKTKRLDDFDDKFVVLYIGRHAMEKRQSLLIEAIARSKYKDKIQLILCGKGEDSKKLNVLGKKLPVTPLIGYVSHEKKMAYLNTADLYVHPSIVELESISCLEAIGCDVPSLIGNSPYSATTQFAIDDRFLFKADDADDLAKKIDYFYEHRSELKEYKKDIMKMAKKYCFNKCMDKLESLYDDVLSFYKNKKKISIDQIQQSKKQKGLQENL